MNDRRLIRAAMLLALIGNAVPTLAQDSIPSNPLRGQPAVIEAGRALFNANCARCHGTDAAAFPAGGPDLRRLDAYCRRVEPGSLRDLCRRDNDAYFLGSVLHGKTRVGVEHMPAWEGVLQRDEIWSIRSWLETRMQ